MAPVSVRRRRRHRLRQSLSAALRRLTPVLTPTALAALLLMLARV